MPDYRSMFDREYIGAWDLVGRDATVTISKVKAGELTAQGGRKSHKPIIWFDGKDKGFVLNKTNSKTIATLYGNNTDDWVGKKITIYPTITKFGDEDKECIRVRPKIPSAPANSKQETASEPS